MKIALVSLNQYWEDKKANQCACEKYIAKAVSQGAELIIFPELTLTAFTMNTSLAEDEDTSSSIKFFCDIAKTHACSIFFGAMLKGKKGVYNALCVASPTGRCIAQYNKAHPFSYAKEDYFFASGDSPCVVQIGQTSFGLSICYDLRFPEWFQIMADHAHSIVTIANWPAKRVTAWKTLLCARAIENQVFMIGVNRTGTDGNGLAYVLSSALYTPLGDALTPIFTWQDMDIFDCPVFHVKKLRREFPQRQDRRSQLYAAYLSDSVAITKFTE